MTDERIEDYINEGGMRLFKCLEDIAENIVAVSQSDNLDRIANALEGIEQSLDSISREMQNFLGVNNGTFASIKRNTFYSHIKNDIFPICSRQFWM